MGALIIMAVFVILLAFGSGQPPEQPTIMIVPFAPPQSDGNGCASFLSVLISVILIVGLVGTFQ